MYYRFPTTRPRRLRSSRIIRNMVSETSLSSSNLVWPLFIKDEGPIEQINSMPGQYRYPIGDELIKAVDDAVESGVRAFLLFGVTKHKDAVGSLAYDKKGPVPMALKMLKDTFGDSIILMTDVCLCDYTEHGHCGVVEFKDPPELQYAKQPKYVVDNDATIGIYAKIAVNYAEAGADVVAPSGMMDGQVKAIREALDNNGFSDVVIMSYSSKYASTFYGPFREAADSAPKFGDRRSYQMDPRNAYEAIKEVSMDLEEGADIVMVKPAMPYLDVIRLVKQNFPEVPLAAYQVSGEYSMIKAAALNGWLNEKMAVLESLIAIRRAGANVIITYYAKDASRWITEIENNF
ncbi:porphobilinogen synthase [Caldivirga sp.]|uniref:porphobilinogen synthase n=1 Tax=Caldivirga sp. TaxID=2080243 RepID=UPI0025B7FAB0|nr:porphobilinogen synthase [Caldivirga sp.]